MPPWIASLLNTLATPAVVGAIIVWLMRATPERKSSADVMNQAMTLLQADNQSLRERVDVHETRITKMLSEMEKMRDRVWQQEAEVNDLVVYVDVLESLLASCKPPVTFHRPPQVMQVLKRRERAWAPSPDEGVTPRERDPPADP